MNEAVLLFCTNLQLYLVVSMETERTLLMAARTMNHEALIRIFDSYSSALFNYALRMCGDPMLADHIVGDVFAKLLDKFSSGNGPTSNLRSYLYEAAYHEIVDAARYSKRRAPLEVAHWLRDDRQASAFHHAEDGFLLQQIQQIIRTELTADQRHVIILRFIEEFSLRETAAIMGKRVDHVKVIQGRALAALRKRLEYQGMRHALATARIGITRGAVGI
jgi:RNA polymerase sigma-70 factor (ECF subfamily)